tara:strand:+ start:165 stop:359 length:195 start_codon:yes stop_codon:yes gene_type:complete
MSDFCFKTSTSEQRRQIFQKRKLEMLSLFRDGLERRLAAVKASISTLEEQISRNKNSETELVDN